MRKWAFLLIFFAIPLVGQVEESLRAEIDSLKTELKEAQDQLKENQPVDLGKRLTEAYEAGAAHGERIMNLVTGILVAVSIIVGLLTGFGVWQGLRLKNILDKANNSLKEIEGMKEDLSQELDRIKKEQVTINKKISHVAYMNQGYHYFSQDNYTAALKAFESSKATDPSDHESWFQEGNCLLKLGQFERALPAYKKAIGLKPSLAEAYNNMGVILARLKKHDEAIEAYNKAIELRSDYAEAYSNLGNALAKLGHYEEAVYVHDKAIALKPKYYNAYNNKGSALFEWGMSLKDEKEAKKKFREAVEVLNDAIWLDYKYAEAYHNRGQSLRKLGENEKALRDFTKAVKLNPKLAAAHHNRGLILLEFDQPYEAKVALEETIRLNPNMSKAHDNLGVVLGHLKKYPEALAEHDREIQINPDYAEAYDNRAALLLYWGMTLDKAQAREKFEAAKQSAEEATRLSEGKIGYYNLACAFVQLGELEIALENLKKWKKGAQQLSINPWRDAHLRDLQEKYPKEFEEIVGPPPEEEGKRKGK